MRPLTTLALAALLAAGVTAPALAMTVTARVSGGTIPIHAGPGDRYAVLGHIADGSEIPIDQCTQIDSDSRYGSVGDSGHLLWGSGASQWCRIPDYGWVPRSFLVGRGLVNVTPPDFNGPGW